MEQKIALFQNRGMTRDLSISKVNNEFAYENFNVRIIARDHDTLLSVTNERGNKEIELKGQPFTKSTAYVIKYYSDGDFEVDSEIRNYTNSLTLLWRLKSGETGSMVYTYNFGRWAFEEGDSLISPISEVEYLKSELGYILEDYTYHPINVIYHDDNDEELLNESTDSPTETPITLKGTLIGHSVLNNYMVLFTHEEDTKIDHIYRVEYIDEENWRSLSLFDGNLGFDSKHPIETLANYETEAVQKVYWVDGINQPRFINIKKLNYNSDNPSQFDFVTEFNPDLDIEITKTFLGTSSFSSGTIQYFFTYSNDFGQETNIVGKSNIYNLSDQERATPTDSTASCAFKIGLKNLDKRFDSVNIYSIVTTSTLSCNKVATLPITDEVSYVDTGSYTISIDPTTLLYIGGTEIHAETLAQKDNTLFLGNIELQTDSVDEELKALIDATIIKDISGNHIGESSMVEFEYSDKYVFQNNSLGTVYYEDQQLNLGSDKYLFFKGGEKYRFGLVFLTSTGRRSSVYWIGDKVNTLYPKSNSIRTYKAIAKCTIPQEVASYISKNTPYKRAILVRAIMAESDRSVIAQGFVNPTVFNVTQRVLNSPYAMSSWFFRPKNSNVITNTHFSQIPANKSISAEIQNVNGDYDEQGKEITKPPYFSKDEIALKERQVWLRWTVKAYYKDNKRGFYGVTGAEAKAVLEFFNNEGKPEVDNDDGLIPGTTINIGSKWREAYAAAGFNKVWQEFSRSYTKDLYPRLLAHYPKYARYFPSEPTEEMRTALYADWENAGKAAYHKRTSAPLQKRKIKVGGVLANNGLLYSKTLGNRFYIDESIVTLNSPDIEFGEYQTLPDDFKFRIIGYSPLTAGTTDFYMNPEKDNSESSFLPDNLNKENISQYPEQAPTLPFFSGDTIKKDNSSVVAPYIIYPWHKTGALYKKDDIEEYVVKDKILANLKYSLFTNYCWLNKYRTDLDINNNIGDYNYYMKMAWEPRGGISNINIADESIDNVFLNIRDERLYYNNYDFVLSVSSDENSKEKYKEYTTGDKQYTEGLDFLSDTSNWEAAIENSTAPVNVAAKSKKNCILSFNPVGDETIILPSVNADTPDINLPDYYLPWETYVDEAPINDTLITGNYPYYTPDRLFNSGSVYIIELDNTSKVDAYNSFDRDFKNAKNAYSNKLAIAFIEEISGNAVTYLGEDVEYKKNVYPGFTVTVTPVIEEDVTTKYTLSITPGSESGLYDLLYINSEGVSEKTVEIDNTITITKADSDNYSFKIDATYSPLYIGYSSNRTVQSSIFKLNTTETLTVNDINKGVSIKTNIGLNPELEVVYLKDYKGTSYKYTREINTLTEVVLNNIIIKPDNLSIPLDTYSSGKIDTDTFDTSLLFVGELYRDIEDYSKDDYRYGGVKEDALKKNTFVDCGAVTDITESNILYGVEGDSYYQRYDVLKTIPYSKGKDNSIIEIFSGMIESRVNLNGKTDKNMSTSDYTLINTETFNSINKAYTRQDSFNTSVVLDSSDTTTSYPTQFTWTKEKTPGEDIDTWTNITLSGIQTLDGDKGPLRAIRRFQNSLIAFQDKGIAEILFNSRTQIGTQQGVPIEIANSGKVDGKRYITDKAGCINKWSIVETKSGIYFIDNINSSLSLFTGTVKSLSDEKGFKDWIGRNNSTDLWNPVDFNNFVAYWDRVNDDVYFLRGNEEKQQDVLCYNEMLGQFTSFFSYGEVPMMVNVQDKFVAFKEDNNGVNKLWIQGEGEFNNLFGSLQGYHMLYRITPDPYGDKTFSTLEYRADMFDMSNPDYNPYMPGEGKLTGDTFDTLEVWNEYQGNKISIGDSTSPLYPFMVRDKYPDVRRKFRIWRMDIPRDKKGPDNPYGLNRIRNPWIYLKLSKTPTLPNERMEFHDLAVRYFK